MLKAIHLNETSKQKDICAQHLNEFNKTCSVNIDQEREKNRNDLKLASDKNEAKLKIKEETCQNEHDKRKQIH